MWMNHPCPHMWRARLWVHGGKATSPTQGAWTHRVLQEAAWGVGWVGECQSPNPHSALSLNTRGLAVPGFPSSRKPEPR